VIPLLEEYNIGETGDLEFRANASFHKTINLGKCYFTHISILKCGNFKFREQTSAELIDYCLITYQWPHASV
jgi:hypothetical protein